MEKRILINQFAVICLLIGLFIPLSMNGAAEPNHLTVIHTSYPAASNFVPLAPYSCASPIDESNVTQVLAIAAGTPTDAIQYNTTTLVALKGACVKLILVNLSPDVYHSFVIDEVGGGNSGVIDANLQGPNIDQIDMVISNATSDIGFGSGVNVFYFRTPNVNAQFTFYCKEPGHESAGMKGTLYIGAGPSPNNSILSNSSDLFLLMTIVIIIAFVAGAIYYGKKDSQNEQYNQLKDNNKSFISFKNPNMINLKKDRLNCLNCGSEINPGDIFCQNCGSRVS